MSHCKGFLQLDFPQALQGLHIQLCAEHTQDGAPAGTCPSCFCVCSNPSKPLESKNQARTTATLTHMPGRALSTSGHRKGPTTPASDEGVFCVFLETRPQSFLLPCSLVLSFAHRCRIAPRSHASCLSLSSPSGQRKPGAQPPVDSGPGAQQTWYLLCLLGFRTNEPPVAPTSLLTAAEVFCPSDATGSPHGGVETAANGDFPVQGAEGLR